MKVTYDIAVVGSGFAGSLIAMIARRLGKSVILLERGRHPRFAIGESSTPLTNLLLEELSIRYGLPKVQPLSKWGTWQGIYPGLPCGLKRGFSFYHHGAGQPFIPDPLRRNELLVAASPHDRIADVHWYRPDFDRFFVQLAQSEGVEFLDRVKLDSMLECPDHILLKGLHNGNPVEFEARFLIDASGPDGFIHRSLGLATNIFPDFPETQALYTHFRHVRKFSESAGSDSEQPPYPIDDAALHHVFDGGWIWVLRFNNGITSAGVAATKAVADRFGFGEGAPAWSRLLQTLPSVRKHFADAEPVRNFIHHGRLSFRTSKMTGERWAMLPSAAGFVDPLLSTGFPLTLLGIGRLARSLEHGWQPANYAAETDAELLATARLIGALYRNMSDFQNFSNLSLLYFAAASFSETARRLQKEHLAPSFLLHDHPAFGPALRNLAAAKSLENIQKLIEPINIAGLANPDRRNWYPVDASDLLNAPDKLNATRPELEAMLERSGFWIQ